MCAHPVLFFMILTASDLFIEIILTRDGNNEMRIIIFHLLGNSVLTQTSLTSNANSLDVGVVDWIPPIANASQTSSCSGWSDDLFDANGSECSDRKEEFEAEESEREVVRLLEGIDIIRDLLLCLVSDQTGVTRQTGRYGDAVVGWDTVDDDETWAGIFAEKGLRVGGDVIFGFETKTLAPLRK